MRTCVHRLVFATQARSYTVLPFLPSSIPRYIYIYMTCQNANRIWEGWRGEREKERKREKETETAAREDVYRRSRRDGRERRIGKMAFKESTTTTAPMITLAECKVRPALNFPISSFYF